MGQWFGCTSTRSCYESTAYWIFMHLHVHVHVCVHVHVRVNSSRPLLTHTVYTLTHTHTHTYVHSSLHVHVHTHTHTHTHSLSLSAPDRYFTEDVPVLLFTSLPFTLWGVWQCHSHWSRAPFWLAVWELIVHSVLSHKEHRYVLPIVPVASIYAGTVFLARSN